MPKKDCLIICMFSKNETPYADQYIRIIKNAGMEFDIIYFERYGSNVNQAENELLFEEYCPTGGKKTEKLNTMRRYARFIRSKANPEEYRKLFVLTTVPAIMLADILTKRFPGHYLVDIRDYTYEHFLPYRALLGKVIKRSALTVLSSNGFRSFLPKHTDYVLTHNVPTRIVPVDRTTFFSRTPLRIGFVGSIRYFSENIRLIEQFNDLDEYEICFYGTETLGGNLQEQCKEKGYRAFFYGAFLNQDKPAIYRSIDIINSIYDASIKESITAVPNRFYDAAIYKCPIIVSKNTYLQTVVEKYGIGFAVDIHTDNVPEALQKYLDAFEAESFIQGCNTLLLDVDCDMARFKDSVQRMLYT